MTVAAALSARPPTGENGDALHEDRPAFLMFPTSLDHRPQLDLTRAMMQLYVAPRLPSPRAAGACHYLR